jgi:hypothetical protein
MVTKLIQMIDDLGQLYDPEQVDNPAPAPAPQGPGPKPVKKAVPVAVPIPETQLGTRGGISGTDVNEYAGYMPEGVYDSKGDLDLYRGSRQSTLAKIGVRAANLVPNMASQVLGMIGYTGSLLSEWGDNRDYSNAFTQAADAIKDPFGKTYKRSNDVFALSDPTWWIDNIANLAEMAVPFAGEAALAGNIMSRMATGATKLLSAGRKAVGLSEIGQVGARIGQGVAQLGTAAFSAYTEAAMDGATVYQQTYDTQVQRLTSKGIGIDQAKEQAKHIAAQSAATTVQLSTAFTTILNLSSVSPFFKKSDDVVKDVLSNQLKREVGETTEQWASRIKNLKPQDFGKQLYDHHGVAKYAQEAFQEGFEELEQQFAQNTGQDEGEKGTIHGFGEQFKQLNHFFDRTMDQQGALSFVLGAFGGLGQTLLIHSLVPSKYTTINQEGNQTQAIGKDGKPVFAKNGEPVYERKLVTPRTYDEWSTNHVFNNMRDSLGTDISNFSKMQTAYLSAVKSGNQVEADALRYKMFNVANLNAIKNGMAAPWKATYDEIANMDNETSIDVADPNGPTEAMHRGYAKDRTDNEYQKKAQQASTNIDRYQKEYEKLHKRYGTQYEGHEGLRPVVDNIFARKVDLMATDEMLTEHEQKLKAAEAEENEMVQVSNPMDFDEAVGEYQKQITTAQEVHKRLKADLALLNKAIEKNDIPQAKKLIEKYRAVGINDDDIPGALKNLHEKITKTNDLQNRKAQEAEDRLLQSSGYNQWKEHNPDKTFKDYREEVAKKYQLSTINSNYRANIEEARARYNIAQQNYNDIVQEPSVHRFIGKANNWLQKLQADTDRVQAEQRAELAIRAKDKATMQQVKEEVAGVVPPVVSVPVNETVDTEQVAEEPDEVPESPEPTVKEILPSTVKSEGLDNGINPNGGKWEKVITNDNDGQGGNIKRTRFKTTRINKNGEEVSGQDGTRAGLSGREISWDDFKKEFKLDQEDIDSLFDGKEPKTVTIHETAENEASGKNGLDATFHFDKDENSQLNDNKRFNLNYEKVDKNETTQDTISQTIDITEPVTDSPVIALPNESIMEAIPNELGTHMGKKTVDVLSIANSTIAYHEVERNGKYYKITDPTKLSETTNPDILTPGRLNTGHPIRLEVDKDYNGTINIDDELIQDEFGERMQRQEDIDSYFKGDKIIPNEHNIGNIPIKVVDTVTGKSIGYVRRADWVMAKYPNTEDYRNVVDTLYDDEGNPIDNLSKQMNAIMALRTKAIEQYNANGQGVDGKISGKGTGTLIRNMTFNKNTEKSKLELGYARSRNQEKSLLPDPSLQLAIVHSGVAYTGKDYPFNGKQGYKDVALSDGNIVAMVPGANGAHLYVPLVGQMLADGDRKSSVNTVARAVELYLINNGTDAKIINEIDEIQRQTKHDISTEEGLRNFINQYFTYTESFKDVDTSPNAESGNKRERFLFSISDAVGSQTKGNIKIGWAFSGRPIINAKINNGVLEQAFIDHLEEGFNTRARAVNYTKPGMNLTGINSTGTFKDVIYTNAGQWRYTEYPNYNEYVKSFSKTGIYGRNQLPDGTYVYTANPTMPIAVDTSTQFPTLEVTENKTPDVAEVKPEATFNENAANLFDQLSNFSLGQEPGVIQSKEIGTAPENSKPLTEQNLQELYNFTPEANRNGRTVREVLEQLAANGHTFLADGYNPFTRCL